MLVNMYALDTSLMEQKYNKLSPLLSEMGRRVWAATEADTFRLWWESAQCPEPQVYREQQSRLD